MMNSNKLFSIIMVLNLVLIGMVIDEFLVMFSISDVVSFDEAMTRITIPEEIMLGLIAIALSGSIFVVILTMKNMEWKTTSQNNLKVSKE